MRGKLPPGVNDDSDELLTRAKQKIADLQAQASASRPAAPQPASSGAKGSSPPPAGAPAAGNKTMSGTAPGAPPSAGAKPAAGTGKK